MSGGDKIAIVEPLRKPVECPACSSLSRREYYPFCSKRCSDSDLHKWFSERYAILSQELQQEDAE